MDGITILVPHNGNWDANRKYIDFDIDAIFIKTSSNFNELVAQITTQLQLDIATIKLEIKHTFGEGLSLMKIFNDMGVKVYFDLKKKKIAITTYPLSISYTNTIVTAITPQIDIPKTSSKNKELINLPELDDDNGINMIDIVIHQPQYTNRNIIITDPLKQALEIGQIYID
ncbi:hypothetical protein RND71_034620 [Anisodus tanguticus]|uniref:Uncharacterized protein n=1 Tax=Anisodus tanguticus TaxID=243964 RepID=A0AAE1V2S7_9SOLA|nr:hypothetical protein RND71_034620 [Anisodus tanguticus]